MQSGNYSDSELAKFSDDCHAWWDAFGDYAALHAINPLRLAFIQSHCQVAAKKSLDIGCGGGILAEALAKSGAEVTGIDKNATALAAAKQHAAETKLALNYQLSTAEEFASQKQNSFQLVTCMELLEHVPDPESLIRACAQLVSDQGYVFFSTINRNAKAFLQAIVAAEYLLKLLPAGTHAYAQFIKPSELARMARAHHLRLIASQGIAYQALAKRYYLSNDVSVNYLMAFKKESAHAH